MIGSDIGSGRCLAISVKHTCRIGKIWLSLSIRVPMFGLMKNSALNFFNYTQMSCFFNRVWVKTIVYFCVENEKFNAALSYHTWASACGQRCAVPRRNKSAPRTRSELQKQYGKCVLYLLNVMNGAGNYCTLCEARPCVRIYMYMYVHVSTYVRSYVCGHLRSSYRFSGWSIHGKGD